MKKISLKNKKVFIAGHAGLVGQSLYKSLEKEKCKILCVNKKSLDLRDFNKTDKWLKLNKPDYILILAWQHQESIINRCQDFIDRGVKLIVPLPEFKVI